MRLSKILGCAVILTIALNLASARRQEVGERKPETETVRKEIPFKTIYVLSRDIGRGRVVPGPEGKPGAEVKTYRVIRDETGKVVRKELMDTVNVPATDHVIKVGKEGYATSRGSFEGRKVMTVEATAYMPSDGLSRPPFRTKMGNPAKFGVIAVDPRVIPLGSYVYVEGYGFAYACDTGGAIKGKKIDVCLESRAATRQWGRRQVKIHILSSR